MIRGIPLGIMLIACWSNFVMAQTASYAPFQIPEAAAETQIRQHVDSAIKAGKLPGCVIVYGNSQQSRQLVFGNRQLKPEIKPMMADTVFDLASLTKPVATAMSIMLLQQQGQLELDSPIAEYLPSFGQNGKQGITIRDALLHRSGLIPDNPLSDYKDGQEEAWQKICELKPTSPVGKDFRYSDVNFIVLGKLVEQRSGKSLNHFAEEHFFQPSEMKETMFNPPETLRKRCAATEQRDKQWIIGQVHDPRAFALGGVAGHAGLFSTADDLRKFSQQILKAINQHKQQAPEDSPAAEFPLSRDTLLTMTQAYEVSKGTRGLGWDKNSPYSSNRGKRLSPAAFGHGGFTGTVLWIDPEQDFFFIFLSNRVHPDGSGSVNRLAGQLQDILLQWDSQPEPNSQNNSH